MSNLDHLITGQHRLGAPTPRTTTIGREQLAEFSVNALHVVIDNGQFDEATVRAAEAELEHRLAAASLHSTLIMDNVLTANDTPRKVRNRINAVNVSLDIRRRQLAELEAQIARNEADLVILAEAHYRLEAVTR